MLAQAPLTFLLVIIVLIADVIVSLGLSLSLKNKLTSGGKKVSIVDIRSILNNRKLFSALTFIVDIAIVVILTLFLIFYVIIIYNNTTFYTTLILNPYQVFWVSSGIFGIILLGLTIITSLSLLFVRVNYRWIIKITQIVAWVIVFGMTIFTTINIFVLLDLPVIPYNFIVNFWWIFHTISIIPLLVFLGIYNY